MGKFTHAALALFVGVCALSQAGNAAQMALKIDKTDDTGLNYFMAPPDSSLDKLIGSNLTVEAWVNPNDMAADNPCGASYQVVNKESSYEIALRTDADGNTGVFMVAIWPADNPDIAAWDWNNSEAIIPPHKWTHLAVTYDGLIIRMFVNGKFLKSFDQWTGPNGAKAVLNTADKQDNPPEPLRIGRRHNSGPCHQMFDGLIDEVRISKVVRYTDKGFDVPTQEFTPDADTVALYHFDDSSTGAADVKAVKDKFDAIGLKEDQGQTLQDASADPALDIKGVSKDASSFHNDGALIGKAVLVPADTPIKE